MARKSGKAVQDALGWALLGVVALILIGIGAAAAFLRPPPTDEATLCRTDAPLSAHTIVLVDVSEKLEPRHRKRLRAAIESERARLKQFDKLTILAISAEDPREPRTLFSLCHPGDGRSVNPLWGNPAKSQARWEEAFGAPLEKAARSAAAASVQAESPILESLISATRDPDFAAAVPTRRFVLVSDLMEMRRGHFSLYALGADLDGYRSSGLPSRAPDLSGVSVRVVVLDRADMEARQQAAQTTFWEPWFMETGADVAWEW